MNKVRFAAGFLCVLIVAAVVYLLIDNRIAAKETLADTNEVKDQINDLRQEQISRTYEPYVPAETLDNLTATETIERYAQDHDLTVNDYPLELVELYERNPETETYVLEYPLHSGVGIEGAISIEDELDSSSGVPLFLQWDQRWGYKYYGRSMMGLSGCGPTCLAMVASYLLDDPSLNPAWVADFSSSNGYYDFETGNGTLWTLMSEGAETLGLQSEEVPLEESVMIEALEEGKPIICSMGPGVFTEEGHFIVIADYEDGYYTINDPNSRARSERLWTFDEFADQISGMWCYSA